MIARKATLILIACASNAIAQTPADSLQLGSLRQAAIATDPRTAQLRLLQSQSGLRMANISSELKPSISVEGLAQHQSDVARFDVDFPGITLPIPSRDTYDAHVGAQQKIFDPSIRPRRAIERAQLAVSESRVRTAQYSLLESVNSAYFTALRAQTQIAELETTLTDLEAQLKVAAARVSAGTALASEANAIRAELLRRVQTIAEQRAARSAAIAVLGNLTGLRLDTLASLTVPSLDSAAVTARTSIASIRNRPEYRQFESSRELIRRTGIAKSAQDLPRIFAFGRLGYGRPGLNPLANRFDTYWLTGIQLQWTPWNWGMTSRDRQISALESQILTTEEQAFAAQLDRAVQQDIASIDRLQSALAEDEEIIGLREGILAEARARFGESVITSAEYIDRQTDVLAARLSRATHRVELAQARAHLLNTLGIEVR